MKAVQSLVYAFSGVNIFAKATAKSMKNASGSAKEAGKSLAGVHNEINNVSDNSNGGGPGNITPNMDLSQMDNTPNSIIDIIKNGNWYEIGSIIGKKINEAMEKIPWNKIQNTARKIGKDVANLLNGAIETINWDKVGNTFAQGLNTIIYTGYEFITTFNWSKLGESIANAINSFFQNTDWGKLAQTLSKGVQGILDSLSGFLKEIDIAEIIINIGKFIFNIDFDGLYNSFFETLGSLAGSLTKGIIKLIEEGIKKVGEKFQEWKQNFKEHGIEMIIGLLEGILNPFEKIREWINEHILQPFTKGFKDAFGIHSHSTVMAELGIDVIQGLLNGITSLVNKVNEIWQNMKNTVINKFNEIKMSITNIWNNVKDTTLNVWNTIKDKVKEGAQGAWNAITNIFNNIPNWFHDKFTQAWQNVKNVFSTGGMIFDGIKDGILNGLKSVINAIIRGMNKVIAVPFNGLNTSLRKLRNISIAGINPFTWISTLSVPQIPELAKGGVLYNEQLVRVAEYSGASNNPEIVSPQSIMYDTMVRALSDVSTENNNDRPIGITVNVGNERLGRILLNDLRNIKRQSGQDLEVLVGG